jgi:hypothetical protein
MQENVFHGTKNSSKNRILKENFKKSEARNDWLGSGVYFFTEGIGCPIEHARNWCMYKKGFNENDISILKVNLHIDDNHLLDVTNYDGIEEFNSLRSELLQKHTSEFPSDRTFSEDNKRIWDMVADLLDLHAVLNHLYICKIANNLCERSIELKSNVPNSTVLCVKKDGIINLQDVSVL